MGDTSRLEGALLAGLFILIVGFEYFYSVVIKKHPIQYIYPEMLFFGVVITILVRRCFFLIRSQQAELEGYSSRLEQKVEKRTREVRESEETVRGLVETSTDAIISADEGGRITLWNKAAERIFGYTKDEALGGSLEMLVPEEHREGHIKGFKRYIETGEARLIGKTTELEALRKDGTIIPVELSLSALRTDSSPVFTGVIRDISERRRAEEAIREAESKFRDLAEKSLVGVYLIQEGVFKYVNPKMAEIFGYTVEELVDKKGPEDLTLPGDWPLVRENLRKRLDGEVDSINYDFMGRTKDGRIIQVEVYGKRTTYQGKPAVIGSLLDITERKKAEEALRESEEKFRTLVEEGNDGIVIIQDGLIKFVNPKVLELSGFAPEEVLGKPFRDVVAPEHLEIARERYMKRMSGEELPSRYEIETITKNGSRVPIEVSASLIEYKGKPADMAILRDITERKMAENVLQRS